MSFRLIPVPLLLPLATMLAAGSPAPKPHTFSDQFGHSFTGEILEVDGAQFKVRREDGQIFTVEVAKLTDADAAYVTGWQHDHARFQLKVDAVSFHVTAGNPSTAGSTSIQNMAAGYEIHVTNNDRAATAGLRVEYNIFALRQNQVSVFVLGSQFGQNGRGRNGQNNFNGLSGQDVVRIESTPLRITGAIPVPSLAFEQTVTLSANPLVYTKSMTTANVFETGQLVGVWVRVMFEDKVVAEYLSGENLQAQGWQAVASAGAPAPGS
jgi:hypothetical protein